MKTLQHRGFIVPTQRPRPIDPVVALIWIGILAATATLYTAILHQVLA